MRSSDRCSRVLAGGAIVIAHALALYAAATIAPSSKPISSERSLAVAFVPLGAPPSKPRWSPAEPAPPELLVFMSTPAPPQIEERVKPAALPPDAMSAGAPRAEPIRPDESGQTRRVSAVEYVRELAPRYPAQSRRLKEQGVVVLRVVIDELGRACEIEVATSSGYARLDRAAREAVARAAFRPYTEDGAPRRATVFIPVEFFLNRSTA